jgi:hypothetical protein
MFFLAAPSCSRPLAVPALVPADAHDHRHHRHNTGDAHHAILFGAAMILISLLAEARFSVFLFIWIPFGDHPLKLERYRED